MKRIGLGVLLLAAVPMTACVEADPSLVLSAPLFAVCTEDEAAGVSCEFNTDMPPQAYMPTINLNALSTAGQPLGRINQFTLGANLVNRLQKSDTYSPIGDGVNLRTDQNIVQLNSFTIEFPPSDNLAGLDALDTEAPYVVQVGSDGSESGAAVTIIDPTTIANWKTVFGAVSGGQGAAIVPVKMRLWASGTTVGGEVVESNILEIPMQVCTSCDLPTTPLGVIN
ncbi:MAG: hypothetical protein R3E66_19625 [bacterium]